MWILALAALGCRGILGIEQPITSDGSLDAPASCTNWHPQGFDPCTLGAPMPMLHLSAGQYTYDTTTTRCDGPLDVECAGGMLLDSGRHVLRQSQLSVTQSDGSAVAVWSIDTLAIDAGATISVVGKKPLLVVAWSSIAIDGVLDAGSHIGVTNPPAHIAQTVQFGAGANEACGANAGREGTNAGSSGSGGGGGGGMQGAGGAGAASAGTSVAGGMAGASVPALVIRGGCPGGASGAAGPGATTPASSSSQTLGGAGGGALRLVAHDAITVTGSVGANGAGGAGAPLNSACGGGGGGSGGYVAFEAPTVTLGANAKVTANGGGGGGGGGNTIGDAGNDGADGKFDVQPAPGGGTSNDSCGQPGGVGSAGTELAGSHGPVPTGCTGGASRSGGGGGGGGGAGFLFVASPGYTAAGTAKISPPMLVQ